MMGRLSMKRTVDNNLAWGGLGWIGIRGAYELSPVTEGLHMQMLTGLFPNVFLFTPSQILLNAIRNSTSSSDVFTQY